MPERIHIATAADDNYAQHVATMLCSLFINNTHSKFDIYLLHQNINQKRLDLLTDLVESYGHTLIKETICIEDTQQFVVSGHITLASYFRIFLSIYVHKDVDKLLYLDADLIVYQAITDLWRTDISQYVLGAVESVTPGEKLIFPEKKHRRYFNAGVLLINLRKWREENIMNQTINFINHNPDKLTFHDQDALNAVLHDKWLPLHPKYNMQGALFMNEFKTFKGDPNEIEEAILHPVIIHYSTPLKPWHYLSFHPYTTAYYQYLALTPWRDFEPTDKSFVRIMRKAVRPFFRKIGIEKILGKHLY